jgi:O-acetyl-ADP-ribose deacetylase (regulator of RNase III)
MAKCLMGCGFFGSGDLGLCTACTRKYEAMPPDQRPDLAAAQHAAAEAEAAAAAKANAAELLGNFGVVGGSVADVSAAYLVKPPEEGQSAEQVEQNVADFHRLLLESPLPPLQPHLEPLGSGVDFRVGDITTLDVDAIVNAAQETLGGGGGIDGAIHRAAGPGLLEECLALPGDAQGQFTVRCPTGQARITAGHGLPARHVIHTVGPYTDGDGEMQPELLRSCYRESLRLAGERGLSSVAFPLISAGFYGHSEECVLRCMLAESRAFLERQQAEGSPPMKITAVLFPGVGGAGAASTAVDKRMYQEHLFLLLREQYFPPAELLPGIAPAAARALVQRMRVVPAGGARPSVLLMTGGLCPVHSGHLQAMVDTVAGLRAAGLYVVGGALSPSSDEYVSGKRAVVIPHGQRCALVDGCGTDLAEGDGGAFLFADRWEGGQETFQSFTAVARSLAGRLAQFAKRHAVAIPVVCYVAGSDNAGFAAMFEGEVDLACAVVRRPGASGGTISESLARTLEAGENLYLVDGQGMDISSTELLRLVAAGADAAALAEFVQPSVARWLVEESPYRETNQ